MDASDFPAAAAALARCGRWLHTRGWSPATSSNYSQRLSNGLVAITTSGRDKEELTAEQIMTVDLDARPVGPGKPSAETLLHTRLYRRFPGAGAVLHTHSISATVLSRRLGAGCVLRLAGYELAKAFPGIQDHLTPLLIPILCNSQDMPELAAFADVALNAWPEARAYLIVGHGTYTWGPTLEDTRRQLEALEFLFACELAAGAAR